MRPRYAPFRLLKRTLRLVQSLLADASPRSVTYSLGFRARSVISFTVKHLPKALGLSAA